MTAQPFQFSLIARRDGSSTQRRQRRFATVVKLNEAIERWRAQGFNTWWVFDISADGSHALARQWRDE